MRGIPGVVALIAVCSILTGCGGSSVELKPNYHNKILHPADLKRDSVLIEHVTDHRPSPSNSIGIAQVGAFNKKVPYVLLDSLSVFVRRVLDSLFVVSPSNPTVLPVTVYVDSFLVGESEGFMSEYGSFECRIRFVYPVSAASIGQVVTRSAQEASGMDVTNSLEELIYLGVVDCARQFVSKVVDPKKGFAFDRSQPMAVDAKVDSMVASNAVRLDSARGEEPALDSAKRFSDIAISYLKGGKVATGLRGGYESVKQIGNGNAYFGSALSFIYMDIKNNEDQLSGTFFNFGGRLMLRYLLTENKVTPYLGVGLSLVFGGERIEYPGREEKSFFAGPLVEEVLGIGFGRSFALEGGAYQLKYFGSLLLPSDTGFLISVRIGI